MKRIKVRKEVIQSDKMNAVWKINTVQHSKLSL